MNAKTLLAVSLFALGFATSVSATTPAVPAKGPHAALPCTTCHSNESFKTPTKETCFQCHGSYEKIAARTAKMTPNPHSSHRGEKDCSACHSMHSKSRLECNDCHNFAIKMKGE